MVVNTCIEYREEMFIGVGDIHPDGQLSHILSISANKNGDKSAIFNLILTALHRIHGRIVINACVKYRKKIFIGFGDIHLDGQIFF